MGVSRGSCVQVGGNRVQHPLAGPPPCAAGLGGICLQPAGWSGRFWMTGNQPNVQKM